MMRFLRMLPVGALFIGIMGWAGSAHALPHLANMGRHESSKAMTTEQREDAMRMRLHRITVRGTVEKVTEQTAYIRTKPTETVIVELGPQSYWNEHHWRLTPGERVSVSGWYDRYVNSDIVFATKISGPKFAYVLAERNGRPMWPTSFTYVKGWAPTYDRYETWYRSTYRYEPVANASNASSTGHVKTAMHHRESKRASSKTEKTSQSNQHEKNPGSSW